MRQSIVVFACFNVVFIAEKVCLYALILEVLFVDLNHGLETTNIENSAHVSVVRLPASDSNMKQNYMEGTRSATLK